MVAHARRPVNNNWLVRRVHLEGFSLFLGYNEVVEDGSEDIGCGGELQRAIYMVKSHLLLPLPLIDLTKSKTCKRPSRG